MNNGDLQCREDEAEQACWLVFPDIVSVFETAHLMYGKVN